MSKPRATSAAKSKPGMIARFIDKAEQPVPVRPMWQRIVFPIIGLVLIVIGVACIIVPGVPGSILIPIGFPLLFCYKRKRERWARRIVVASLKWIRRRYQGSKRMLKRLFKKSPRRAMPHA